MCGFIYYKKFDQNININDQKVIKEAGKSLFSRGPDDQKIFVKKNTIINFYRLKIIDLSDKSSQPISNFDKVMAFNGMIYNFNELNKINNRDSIKSDTNSLFNFLNENSFQKLDLIDGMYSVVFENFKEKSVFFFRDEFGQKPLYYFINKKILVVSSQIKPIKKIVKNLNINYDSLNFYLKHSFFPSTMTIFKEINKVQPGSCIIFNETDKSIKSFFFKNLKHSSKNLKPFDINELENQIDNSCKYISQADTKKALLLSGGVDSSIVYHYMKKHTCFEPYFLNVEDKYLNEKYKILDLEINYGDKINKINLTRDNFKMNIHKMLSEIDEPHGDPGYFNSYYISKQINNSEKVVFTGDGGDELFLGYETFKATSIPKLFNLFVDIIKKIIPNNNKYMSLKFKINQYSKGSNNRSFGKFFEWISNNFGEYDLNNVSNYQKLFYTFKNKIDFDKSNIENLYNFYINIFLPEFICSHTDRSLMMSSKEGRSPFLNYNFFKYANNISIIDKYSNFSTKKPLKKLAKKIGLPKRIYASRKVGFTIPLARWFLEDKSIVYDKLKNSSLKIDAFMDKKIINKILEDHFKMKQNNYRELYNLLVLETYLNEN